MTAPAQWLIILFGVWIIAVGLLMLIKPQAALRYLGKAASTHAINILEITWRLIAGIALAIYAEHSKFPDVFRVLGYFIIATSALLYFVPRRWHARYAVWWAENLPASLVRFASFFAFAAGAFLIYAAV